MIHRHDLKPPATIIIGEVVGLRDKLNWFERLPLFGQRIVVTRARGQAEALSSRLRALGADAIDLPTIEIQPALDYEPLDQAIAKLGSYDWLIFTSANGVRFFLERLDRSAVDLRALRARICAIGPATRAAVEALHLKVDVMGKDYVAEGMLAALRLTTWRAGEFCCRAQRWPAIWCLSNWRGAARWWTSWKLTARWRPRAASISRRRRTGSPSPVLRRFGTSLRWPVRSLSQV